MAEADFDIVIHAGKLVTAEKIQQADLGIRGEQIAAIGQNLTGKRMIEASGMLVLPGGVDPHVHLDTPVGATRSSDDWFTGTHAAACGGTTTLIDFVEPSSGESLAQALAARRKLAEEKTVLDFGLHMTIRNDAPETLGGNSRNLSARLHLLQSLSHL